MYTYKGILTLLLRFSLANKRISDFVGRYLWIEKGGLAGDFNFRFAVYHTLSVFWARENICI